MLVTAALGEESAHSPLHTVATGSGRQEREPSTERDWPLRLGLARLILRLSAGRAGVARPLVLAAVRRLRTDSELGPEQLLDLPAAGGPDQAVGTHLLDRLLPNSLARRRLVFYSPALQDRAAQRLSHTLPPADPGGVPAQEAKQHLRQNCWPPAEMSAPPAATGPCPACSSEGHPVHQATTLLVRDLWQQSAPLAVPDE